MSTVYWKDTHNRLFKEAPRNRMYEVFSGATYNAIPTYIQIEENPQQNITEAILIFMRRKEEINSLLWTAFGGAYIQDLDKISTLDKMIERANAELANL
jgi:hypothetical protein